MSVWHVAEEFDIDYPAKEVDFYVGSDYNGNIYLSVSFEQINDIYKRILEKEKKE